jgi:hypothetical protein
VSSQANTTVEGKVFVEVEIRLPNNKVIPFDSVNAIHVKSVITESLSGPAVHELTVKAPSTDYMDGVIRFSQSQGTPKIRYRIGVGSAGNSAYLPWQNHLIKTPVAILEGMGNGAGHMCRIDTHDNLFTISRATKVAAHRGKISSIVQKIAESNGLTESVIEETKDEGMWIQSFSDDLEFIRSRLLHRAVNSKGRGNYNFYIQDNVVHFHTPDYQAALKDVVYYGANMTGLTQIDDSQSMLEFGASGVKLMVHDPYTGQMKEVSSDPSKALKLGNVMNLLNKVVGADMNVPFHLSTNSPSEAENIAQSLYEKARSQTLSLKLNVTKSIFIRVGDIVRIGISPSPNKTTVWSGTYLVTGSKSIIDGGALVSSFILKRGEFQAANTAATTVHVFDENVIVNEQEAPGQALNIKATESSGLSHGAGQSASTSVFSTTRDRNSAPS